MSVPTTPLPIGATIALALGLGLSTASTGAWAQTPEAPPPLRSCEGETLTLAWGAMVRDSRGPCRPVRAIQAQRAVARAQATTEAARPCPNRRSYMGGALLICDDQPRARSPR